ncbi:MAG: RNA-guided endonuclease TnpB family protein [Chlamydiota bacterium]
MPCLAHKIELKLNNKQRTYFKKACGVSRFTWNWALSSWDKAYEENKNRPKEERSPVNGMALKKEFNKLKKEQFPWTFEVTKYASQQPFIHLNLAFGRFFKGLSGKPKFKKRNKSVDSFYVGGDQVKIKNKNIWVPNLGWVRLKEWTRFEGPIRSATFSRKADRWFVSLQIDTTISPKSPLKEAVGVDLGINSLVHTSDGVSILSPKPLRKGLKALRRASRRLAKKENGSKARGKQKLKVQKIHFRISNIRKDTLHKTSSYLISQYKGIAIENLNVCGMLKNHKLSRAISDLGFYELRRQLEYKSRMYGNNLVVAGRFFPSSKKCSSCGSSKKDLSLKERVFSCDCGISLDRDLNASLNLRNLIKIVAMLGMKILPQAS